MMTSDELRNLIAQLSEGQRNLLASQLSLPEGTSGSYKGRRIVAYVAGDPGFEISTLRSHLKDRLPAHMVPAAFVMLDKMPRLPNGKINHRGLPAPEETSGVTESGYVEPRVPVEEQLAKIWEEVLGIHPVGIHDNFFEIGGDSILSIQIVARARKAGLTLGPNQLFEHQTIAELGRVVQPQKTQVSKDAILTGAVPLTPIQHWFFEQHKAAPHHWNQVMTFKVDPHISADSVANAVDAIVRQHESLRLSFAYEEGCWKAMIAASAKKPVFHYFDLRHHEKEHSELIKERSEAVQRSFRLEEGGLFQALFFECEPIGRNELILVAHHLLVDAVSWQILCDDLNTLLNNQERISGFSKTASYPAWSAHLTHAVEQGKFDSELGFWQTQELHPALLPTDHAIEMPVTEESIHTISFELDRNITGLLLREALATYRLRPEDILVTAFLRAVEKWSGIEALTLWFEHHGRRPLDTEMDLSSTVGWFTAFYPLRLSHDPHADSGSTLRRVKEQLRQVANGGLGYGALRYLGSTAGRVSGLNQNALVIFNYLGNQTFMDSGPLAGASMVFSGTRAPESERNSLFEINCYVQDGRLQVRWSFSRAHYRVATIEQLGDDYSTALRELISHCTTADSGGYTASDFPESGLSQEDLDALLKNLQ